MTFDKKQPMKNIPILIFAVVALGIIVFFFATNSSKGIYAASSIEIVSEGFTDQGISLIFRSPEKAGHFCPGANYRIEGTKILYELVRASRVADYTVDIPSTVKGDGSVEVIFPFPSGTFNSGDSVELVDFKGRSHGEWKWKSHNQQNVEQGGAGNPAKPGA